MSVVHTCSSQLSITIRLVFVQNSRKLKEIFPQFTSFLRSRSRHTLCLQLSSNFTGKDWRKCSQKQGKGFEADNLKWNIWCCYFNVLQVLATAQAQCLQHCVALAYLAHFFSFPLWCKTMFIKQADKRLFWSDFCFRRMVCCDWSERWLLLFI